MAGTGYAGSDEYKWTNCVSGTGWTYAVVEETLLCEIERKTILGSHGLLDASNEWGIRWRILQKRNQKNCKKNKKDAL